MESNDPNERLLGLALGMGYNALTDPMTLLDLGGAAQGSWGRTPGTPTYGARMESGRMAEGLARDAAERAAARAGRDAVDEGWRDEDGPAVRGPEEAEGVAITGESGIIGTGVRGKEILTAKARHESSDTDPVYREVNIHGARNSELDDVDLIDQIIYEDKDASKLYMENPNYPQTEQQWVNKQIFDKTANRILALQQQQFSMSSGISPTMPPMDGLKGIRTYVFRINADTPALREAVQAAMERLSLTFPEYEFYAVFGGE